MSPHFKVENACLNFDKQVANARHHFQLLSPKKINLLYYLQ
jgi:hypothetical protein